jgi:plasmid stabilization system protein ParE
VKLVYSEDAVTDLSRLRVFIAEKDPEAASRVASELLARIENLCQFPYIGLEVPQAPEPGALRDMMFGNYIVRYAAQQQTLIILRIWHHFENRGGDG